MPGDASRRNGLKGGRPKGSRNAATLEREAVLTAYRVRVCWQAQRLLDAEMTTAMGCSYLIRKPKEGGGKAEVVKDEATIRRFLDGELEGDAASWFYITTEKPDTLTIRNMLDRTFDKPAQRMEVSGPDGAVLPVGGVVFVVREQEGATNRS